MIIYKAVNRINGKMYVGQTKHTLDYRKYQHLEYARQGGDTHFCQAIRKYGEDNFEFEVICTANDKATLNELEIYYIKKYDTIKHGYNMIAGGCNNVMDDPEIKLKHDNKMRSDGVRKKISDTMKEYRKQHPFTEEHRAKISKAMKGNHNFGNCDTRSVPCYCIVDGKEYHFHNYLEAGVWWYENYRPFHYSASTYQDKIKQSIREGYATYGRGNNKKVFDYIKWYREGGDVNEKVVGS